MVVSWSLFSRHSGHRLILTFMYDVCMYVRCIKNLWVTFFFGFFFFFQFSDKSMSTAQAFQQNNLTFKTYNTNMSVVQMQHIFCLMCDIETKTFTDAHVPCLTKFSIKTFFNATCTLFPFSRKLKRRKRRNRAHKVQQKSQNKK